MRTVTVACAWFPAPSATAARKVCEPSTVAVVSQPSADVQASGSFAEAWPAALPMTVQPVAAWMLQVTVPTPSPLRPSSLSWMVPPTVAALGESWVTVGGVVAACQTTLALIWVAVAGASGMTWYW